MTVQGFYNAIDGDYDEILGRLVTEDRIKKFLKKMLDTDDMTSLKEAWGKGDGKQIFAYSHRLKGIAQNLSLTHLIDKASFLTEAFRNGPAQDMDAASTMYRALCEDYETIADFISQIE